MINTIAHTIELNVSGLDDKLVDELREAGKSRKGIEVFDEGNKLIFASKPESDNDNRFQILVGLLGNVCEKHGVDYIALLDL